MNSVGSALIARLIQAGTPPELVADIAMELGRAEAERSILASRREHERNRKAKSRDVTGQNVTERDSLDKTGQPPLAPAGSISSALPSSEQRKDTLSTPSVSHPSPSVPKPRGSRLPKDWTPSESLLAYGVEQGLTRAEAASSLETMRLWAHAGGPNTVKLDWVSAGQGWLRRDADKARLRQHRSTGPPANSSSRKNGALSLLRKEFARERPDDFEDWSNRNGAHANGAGAGSGIGDRNEQPDDVRNVLDLQPLRADTVGPQRAGTSSAGSEPIAAPRRS